MTDPDFFAQAQLVKDTRVLPPNANGWVDEHTRDATAALLCKLLMRHIPAKVLCDLVTEIEQTFECTAGYVFQDPDDHLARYAINLSRRLAKCTAEQARAVEELKSMLEEDPSSGYPKDLEVHGVLPPLVPASPKEAVPIGSED